MVVERDVHAGGVERAGIGQPFVVKRIAAGENDDGFRQARQRGGGERRRFGVCPVAGRNMMVPEPLHVRRRDQIVALAEPVIGGAVEIGREHRVEQYLQVDRGAAAIARAQGQRRGEIAARAVAHHRDRPVVGTGLQGGPGVVERLGKAMFGGQPIIDADHLRAAFVCKLAADRIETGERAEHPAAAMEVQDAPMRAVPGDIVAHGDGAIRAIQGRVAHDLHRCAPACRKRRLPLGEGASRVFGRSAREAGQAQRVAAIEDRLHVGVERSHHPSCRCVHGRSGVARSQLLNCDSFDRPSTFDGARVRELLDIGMNGSGVG
jgi:hypothetical protein